MIGTRIHVPEFHFSPCKICGKYPKVYRDFGYEESGFGAWCTIECRPFLRKPHCKIEEGKADFKRAFEYATNRWNEVNA